MTDQLVRNLVMLTVLSVWALYLGVSLARGETPERWVWGIAPGVYAALRYRPVSRRRPSRQPPRRGRTPEGGAD